MKCKNCGKDVEFPFYTFSNRGTTWHDFTVIPVAASHDTEYITKKALPLIPICPFCDSELYKLFRDSPKERGEPE